MRMIYWAVVVVVSLMFSVGSLSTAIAAEKSPIQKQIERESRAKQEKQNQERIRQIDRELERNRNWRSEHGNDSRINQEKLNDRTRQLHAEKERLQRQSGNQQRQHGGQSVQQENDRDAGYYGTFGRQGQGQYRGQDARGWNNSRR